MSTQCWVVGYERDGVVSGPFKVFDKEHQAREFVRWCGDPQRVCVGAERAAAPIEPRQSTDWLKSTYGALSDEWFARQQNVYPQGSYVQPQYWPQQQPGILEQLDIGRLF